MPNITNEAAEILIETLMDRLKKTEEGLANKCEETFLIYMFLGERRKDALPDWIKYVYEQQPELAKDIVAKYHVDTIDLSTLECSASDFKSWKE
jgi:hypothetical protein